jgi:hypothetical protein
MRLNTQKIAEKLLVAIILAIAASVSDHLGKLSDSMEQMTQSVIKLNGRLEMIGNDMGLTKTAIGDHESRIRELEKDH